MELDGLKRCLADLESAGVKISSLTTDRHPHIEGYLRKNTSIVHHFDTWHVVKGESLLALVLHIDVDSRLV